MQLCRRARIGSQRNILRASSGRKPLGVLREHRDSKRRILSTLCSNCQSVPRLNPQRPDGSQNSQEVEAVPELFKLREDPWTTQETIRPLFQHQHVPAYTENCYQAARFSTGHNMWPYLIRSTRNPSCWTCKLDKVLILSRANSTFRSKHSIRSWSSRLFLNQFDTSLPALKDVSMLVVTADWSGGNQCIARPRSIYLNCRFRWASDSRITAQLQPQHCSLSGSSSRCFG